MFIYIKNNKIVACSKSGDLKIGVKHEVELEGYYKVINGEPYMITTEQELPGAFFVGDRNWEEFYRKRQLCIEGTKEEEERRKRCERNAKKGLDEYGVPIKKEELEKENNSESEEQG